MKISTLEDYLNRGLIQKNSHNSLPLYIWNYTAKTQYEKLWDEVTLTCRAFVTNKEGEAVSRSFKKFFNIEEESIIPKEKFEVYEKLDGSLITVFWYQKEFVVTSRGSFDSIYSREAKDILNSYDVEKLEKDKCYSFELITPWNRIVCDYGDQRKLVLLAKFDKQGNEYPIDKYSDCFPLAKKFDYFNIDSIKDKIPSNEEGYVIKFNGGKRIKVKGKEYVELHRIVSGISCETVLDILCENKEQELESIISRLPDEAYEWYSEFKNKVKKRFESISKECEIKFKNFSSRKEAATYFLKQKYPNVLFAMLDKKNFESMIWKAVKSEIKNELQENNRDKLRFSRKV